MKNDMRFWAPKWLCGEYTGYTSYRCQYYKLYWILKVSAPELLRYDYIS
jgi:hypothetical protein